MPKETNTIGPIVTFMFHSFFNYYYHYYTHLRGIYTSVSHWSSSNLKSPQICRTLLSILADFNNTVVLIIAVRPLISNSSSPFINPLVSVSSEPITIGITVTYMCDSFFFFSVLYQGLLLSLIILLSLLLLEYIKLLILCDLLLSKKGTWSYNS